MPVTYRIIEELDLVHTTWEGVVTLEDGMRHNALLRADPRFHPGMRQVSDARTAESAVSAAGVRTLARSSAFGPASRRAIVVSDATLFGVSRMYEAQANTAGEVRVFHDVAEALQWLGIDETEFGDEAEFGDAAESSDPAESSNAAESSR